MGFLRRRKGAGRAKWLISFTLLLFATLAVPVLAATGTESLEEPLTAKEAPAPTPSDFAELEAKEREHAEWLSSPDAVKQREASHDAYANLSAGEAQKLLLEAFPAQIKALNADPARVLSGLRIEKALGTYAALVSDAQGERSIVESSVPIKSEAGGEGKQPVDLALKSAGEGFLPKNPLTKVELPASAAEPIRIQGGVEVGLPTSSDHNAEGLGAENLFYPETQETTDSLVSPIARGAEVFEQLRSPESPEQLRFALKLPGGAKLSATEVGGAEVLSASGEAIAEVPHPSAVDAQGTPVPVKMSIEGESLVLEVAHRTREVAYPILVDPQFLEEGSVAYNQWGPSWNDAYNLSNTSSLFAQAKGESYTYGAYTHGQWVYTAPGQTAYIAAATFFSPTFTLPENCAGEQPTNQPHGYAGLYNPSTGGWVGLGIWSGGSSYMPEFQTGWVGGAGVRQAMVGIGTGTTSVHHKCAFTFSVGGVTIQEKDLEAPTIYQVDGVSSSWVKDLTITAHVSDPGLGVDGITLSPEGTSTNTIGSCSGTYTNRCPSTREASWVGGYFLEGERSASLSAYDPLGASPNSDPNHVSSSYTWTTRLDRSNPEVGLEGQLTEAIQEAKTEGEVNKQGAAQLRLPVYNVTIKATDGSNAEAKTKRSGVKNIAVFADGKEMKVPWEAQACPASSCSMTKTYPLDLNGLEGGPIHHLKVVAEDQVGNKGQHETEFEYIPATGMKEEYVLQHFPLPDGKDHSEEAEYGGPELAVNVMNGNLVFHQKDVEVNGPAVDLEAERFYNSELPQQDNTQWGDGWTLAQTPKLEPEETKEGEAPRKAMMLRTTSALESSVGLPTESGGTQFDKKLQAVVTKEPGGGYTVEDQSGTTDTSLAFNSAGKVTELQTPGSARIDYSYEAGDLTEMAVEDPATAPAPKDEADTPTYQSSFGAEGTGNGQFKHPADLAIDASRNIWVADRTNNRVEEFDGAGNFVRTFGWGVANGEAKFQVCTASCRAGLSGEGNGEFNKPTAIAIDPEGDVWVADSENFRVQQFKANGEFISKFGEAGEEVGKFAFTEGIAIDSQGNVYVASSIFGAYSRLQEFKQSGELVKSIASEGTGNGQVKVPTGLAFDGEGNLWVADRNNNRVEAFNAKGEFLRKWQGSGPAAFKPFAIDVDSSGTVWVGDTEHNRIEGFNPYGDLLTSFGSEGTGEGQFKLGAPVGLVADLVGDVWVADSNNNRVRKWIPTEELPPAAKAADPSVQVTLASGLVTKVEGEEAGKTTYSHSGELLTSVSGPQGQTKYEYDSEQHLKKVTLPNGTWAEVRYGETDGRVKSVTVDPAGAEPAKTTYFAYQDTPSRRTTVSPEGQPSTVYDIGADGSVLKWWNAKTLPEIENLSGSLYQNRETSSAITPGDYELHVQAHSVEGIASIEVVANGNDLVDEKTCEQNWETPERECQTVEDPWVTNTGSWPPGILDLEVIVTDANGNVESKKFWVNIPYTPPPSEEELEAPKFEQVKKFREEFGLDLDLKGNEQAIDERIFNLIGDWYNPHTPPGEVARATWERWGVPLRAEDAAELEYRERYVAQAASAIPQWANEHGVASYAGYYVDHRAGGLIYVGFTSNQATLVGALKNSGVLMAPERIHPFSTQPQHSLQELGSLAVEIPTVVAERPDINGLITRTGVDIPGGRVTVGASDPGTVNTYLISKFGSEAPIDVAYDPNRAQERPVRRGSTNERRMRHLDHTLLGGDLLTGPGAEPEEPGEEDWCTLGFGASERLSTPKPNGEARYANFAVTAGHCYRKNGKVAREGLVNRVPAEAVIGTVSRRIYRESLIDGEAIRLEDGFARATPRSIYLSSHRATVPVKGSESVAPGSILCVSGAFWGFNCGSVGEPFYDREFGEWLIETQAITTHGDSGGPVWNRATGKAVGLIEGGYAYTGPTWISPINSYALPNGEVKPGLREDFDAAGGGPFNIARQP